MKIGIDIGGSHIATGLIVENGKILGKETKDIDLSDINETKRIENIIMDTIETEINSLLNRYDYSQGDITKIGIASPRCTKWKMY